nr:hypothetical protein [Ramlibacter alkalitolerans]
MSAVTAEFGPYRERIRRALSLPGVTVKTQEEFVPTGTETLDKLDLYIRECDAVIHLVGDMTGAMARPASVALIRERYPDLAERVPHLAAALAPGGPALSYTQWEAWLALYHEKVLLIAKPAESAERGPGYQRLQEQSALQQAHLALLAQEERHAEIVFTDAQDLTIALLRGLQPVLARVQPAWRRLLAPAFGMAGNVFWRLGRILVVAALSALLVRSILNAGLPRMADHGSAAATSTPLIVGLLVALGVEAILHVWQLLALRRGRAP